MRTDHIIAVACIVGAVVILATGGESGWGWLLVIAVLCL
jgi:hypothetical protein